MTQPELLSALEAHLQQHTVPFSRGDLLAFVASCGPVEDGPVNVDAWSQEFSRSQVFCLVDGATVGVVAEKE